MKNNPFIKNFDSLLEHIKSDIQSGESIFYVNDDSDESIFMKLLVQHLKREIDGEEIKFIAIRDITLKEEFKGNGHFRKFFKELNSLNINLIFHDIISDKLYEFLIKQGYEVFTEVKYEAELISCYKLKK
jgi:hypothetical protein